MINQTFILDFIKLNLISLFLMYFQNTCLSWTLLSETWDVSWLNDSQDHGKVHSKGWNPYPWSQALAPAVDWIICGIVSDCVP